MRGGWRDPWYEVIGKSFIVGREATAERVEKVLPLLGKYLPSAGSKILDLCCGSGPFTFALETLGYDVTGIDIDDNMVALARKYAARNKLHSKILLGDAERLEFPASSFDAVIFLGNPLPHFDIDPFGRAAKGAHRVLKRGGVMISEYRDWVKRFANPQHIVFEGDSEKDVVSFQIGYDAERGTVTRMAVDFTNNRRFKSDFHLWSPWTFRYVMQEAGFKLQTSEQTQGLYIDVHKKQ